MAIYTDSKAAQGQPDPGDAVDAGFSRYEPLIDGKRVIDTYLFGVNLKVKAGDRVCEINEQLLDDDLILDAVAELESEVGLQIFPTQHDERQPFDRNEYATMGYMRLRQRPAVSVEALEIVTSNGDTLWKVDNSWIDTGYLHSGQIYIIPMNVAIAPSASGLAAGGAAFLAILGQASWVPAYWRVKYTTGFKDGKLPRNINVLVGIQTAMAALNLLAQANAKNGSKSVGLDGMSQSSSNPGPDIYTPAIKALAERKKVLVGKLKNTYGLKLFSGNV